MSYDVYIEKDGGISPEDFLNAVQSDPDLVIGEDMSGEGKTILACFRSDPSSQEFIYVIDDGFVWVKSPFDHTLLKMIQLADKLGAQVQGQEMETYRLTENGVEKFDFGA